MLVSLRNGDACVEMLCAGSEAELSLGAGDGADPWQGASLDWTSPTVGNRHCRLRATSILQLHAQGDNTMPSSQLSTSPPMRVGSAQLPLADLRMDDHPFLSLPAGPFLWPTKTSMYIYPAVLPCVESHVVALSAKPYKLCQGMSTIPRWQGEDAVPAPYLLSLTGSVEVGGGGVES